MPLVVCFAANHRFLSPRSVEVQMLAEIRLHDRANACRLYLWQGRPRLFRHCGAQPMHTGLHPVVFSGDTMTDVDRAYNFVRKELTEVGLLAEGKYLDQIELWISDRPSEGESAYIFEAPGPWVSKGYKPGVIYLPSDTPNVPNIPGLTLIDVIRHEFAHAWYYIDPKFFREDWFVRTFGAQYKNCNPRALQAWKRQLQANSEFQAKYARCRSEESRKKLYRKELYKSFVSGYASNCACEDFAETFMFFLKYRNSLDRFADMRPGVYRKLQSVERAVSKTARRLRSSRTTTWRVLSA